MESRKSTEKNQWNQNNLFFLFLKNGKIDKLLARLRKNKRGHKLLTSQMKEGTSPQIPWSLRA